MSQQQIGSIDIGKVSKSLECQADAFYLREHFKIGNDYNKNKFLFYSMYKDIYDTQDCEIFNWLDRKIRGKLEGKIKLSKDKKIEPNISDIIINNYYNTEANYQEVDW